MSPLHHVFADVRACPFTPEPIRDSTNKVRGSPAEPGCSARGGQSGGGAERRERRQQRAAQPGSAGALTTFPSMPFLHSCRRCTDWVALGGKFSPTEGNDQSSTFRAGSEPCERRALKVELWCEPPGLRLFRPGIGVAPMCSAWRGEHPACGWSERRLSPTEKRSPRGSDPSATRRKLCNRPLYAADYTTLPALRRRVAPGCESSGVQQRHVP